MELAQYERAEHLREKHGGPCLCWFWKHKSYGKLPLVEPHEVISKIPSQSSAMCSCSAFFANRRISMVWYNCVYLFRWRLLDLSHMSLSLAKLTCRSRNLCGWLRLLFSSWNFCDGFSLMFFSCQPTWWFTIIGPWVLTIDSSNQGSL